MKEISFVIDPARKANPAHHNGNHDERLLPEIAEEVTDNEDTYDDNGYYNNRHSLSGNNTTNASDNNRERGGGGNEKAPLIQKQSNTSRNDGGMYGT